ncbi:hypothetical protein BTHI11S_03598 [Bosea thiooxidans]
MDARLRLLAIDGGGLRDLVVDQGILCLHRATDRSQDLALRVAVRDLGEIGRQFIARGKAPRAIRQRLRMEPAPGDQDVVLLIGDIDDDMAAGVLDVEQFGVGDRQVFGRACGLDQLGRGQADMQVRDGAGLDSLGDVRRWRVDEIDMGARGLLRCGERRRRVGGDRPGTFRRLGAPPLLERPQVIGGAGLVEEDQRRRIDDAQQLAAGDLPQLRLAVDQDEQGRGLAEDDPGRVVADRDALAGLGFRYGEARLEA